jgi:hypothetical protein
MSQGIYHTAIKSPREVDVSAYEVIGYDLDIKTIGGSHIQGGLTKAKPAQSRAIDDASLSVVER